MIEAKTGFCLAAAAVLLAACSDEPEAPVDANQSATASGDVLGGSISDDMIPLEELRSQSPPAPRATTTVTRGADGETTVETTVTATNGEEGPPPPEPPAPPAADPET